jgi:hypothetical protein
VGIDGKDQVDSLGGRSMFEGCADGTPRIQRGDRCIRPECNRHPGISEFTQGIQRRGPITTQTARVHAAISTPAAIEGRLHARDDSKTCTLSNARRTHRFSVFNPMALASYKLGPMNLGGARVGRDNSLGRGITDRMESGLLTGTHTKIYVHDECVVIHELSTTGVWRVEIGLVKASSVRTQGSVNEYVSPGATGTYICGKFNSSELCNLTPVGDNAGATQLISCRQEVSAICLAADDRTGHLMDAHNALTCCFCKKCVLSACPSGLT